MPRPPGSAIGRYQILGFIARGESSVVYQALEPESGRLLALKILPPSATRDPEMVKRFLRQADQSAGLEHAHILPVVDYGREEGLPFVATAFAEGGSLQEKMVLFRDEPAALSLVASLADALKYLHQRGIVHGRIEPRHILFDTQDQPLLTGFGRPYSAGDGREPAYVAPEQRQGLTPDSRTDIYQLGALLYELLLDYPPGPEPDLAAAGPVALPAGIRGILLRALAAAPEDRFSTAAEMHDLLTQPAQVQSPAEPQPDEPEALETELRNTESLSTESLNTESATATAEHAAAPPPDREKDQRWLAAAGFGLLVVLALCCLLAIFALISIGDRLREPIGTAQVDTNVRSGPAVGYALVGILRKDEQATIHGVSPDGDWWQIAFEDGPGGRGWVPVAFIAVERTGNVDVIQPPIMTPFPAAYLLPVAPPVAKMRLAK